MEALFADECANMAHSEHKLQNIVRRFIEASYPFGLTISLSKTEIMHQPAPGSTATLPSIKRDGTQLKSVNHIKYLESIILIALLTRQ